ncbi:phage major capsid protein [Leeia sp. TBRC 13508]|uniref:Phage major capsid protein n=1 Tax=Leeia speluncae TaxID=2884804 RepID=A0ABS8D7U2_9NEIS|nr:phage major capsid protein [Leeia speluncae]MCB6184280.1 phage major capsid protein [Leeia speluncae]
MSKLDNYLRERAEVHAKAQAIASATGEMTVEQQAEFQSLNARFGELTKLIQAEQAVEEMNAKMAQPVDRVAMGIGQAAPPVEAQASRSTVPATPRVPEVAGAKVARMAVALAAAGGNSHVAAKIAADRGYGDDVSMALSTTTPGAGGILIPQSLSSEVIEVLRPKAVVRRLGARTVPLVNGKMTIPRVQGGAVVGYVGADDEAAATGLDFGDLELSSKTLNALVPIGNDLLRVAGTNQSVDQIVIGDLTSAIAAREDKAFIRDNGTANLPKGLRSWVLPANTFVANAVVNLANIDADLNKAILRLENSDVALVSPGWVMSPTTYRFLDSLRDGNGNKVYPELEAGLLKGYPVGRTTQVPSNLGASSDESEVYFADFAEAYIGEDLGMTIDYSKDAAYKDSQGNMVSAFQKNQTLIRVMTKHDFGLRHAESVSVITGVKWH